MISILLSVRWKLFRNALLRSNAVDRRRARANILFSGLVVFGVGEMSYAFFEPFVALSQSDPGMAVVLRHLPSAAFFMAFWMLLLSGVTVGIQRFYLNQEMTLLLSTPIRPRVIFLAKFVESAMANAGLFLTIGAPVILAFGLAYGHITPPFLVYLLLLLVAFAALPTGLGILLSFILMRLLPATRTRDLLGALGILAFACIYFALSVSVTRTQDVAALREGTASLAARLSSPIFGWGPWSWAGEVLSGERRGAGAWQNIGALWGLAIAAIWITALAAQWLYWRGWSVAQEAAVSTGKAAPVGQGWERRLALLPSPMRAVFLKDFRSLRRDMRQLSLLFIPIALIAVFLFQISQTDIQRVPAVLQVLGLYPILAMICLRLSMSGFIGEHQAMWLMMSAPNDPRTVLAGKFIYAYALSFPLAAVATLLCGFLKGLTGAEGVVILMLALCAVAGFCGIGVGASALFSDFSTDNLRFTVSAGGRLVTFACQVGYLVLLGFIAGIAWVLVNLQGLPMLLTYGMAGIGVALVSAAFVVFPLVLGALRLRRLEW